MLAKRLYSTALSPLFQAAIKDAAPAAKKGTAAPFRAIPVFTTGDMHVSHRKLNHLSRLIAGMSLTAARQQMRAVLQKRGVNVVAMLNRVENALKHNYAQDPLNCYIKQAWVGKGTYIKRIRIHGRGRTGRVTRPKAHLKVMVEIRKPAVEKDEKFEKMVKMFRKHQLFVTMKDTVPVQGLYPIWSNKPWKYLTSPKWVGPENALYQPK